MPYGSRFPEDVIRPMVLESIPFSSTCPKCRLQRRQRGSRAALQRLLDRGHPVEAFCEMCGEYWPISPQERGEVARGIAG